MLSSDIVAQVRRLQITTGRQVSDVLAGAYHSVFKGRGMEFDEVREYIQGDDVRFIDWNVTARLGSPHIKTFVEERELTIIFCVDVSSSGAFGTADRFKSEIAAELCAVLAFSAVKNNDKVGLLLFSDDIELFIPPKKGTRHALRVIRELLYHRPERSGTDIGNALQYLNKVTRRKSIVFLVSDFFDSEFERDMLLTSRRHDLIPVVVRDPAENVIPPTGLLELEDAETGERIIIDAGSSRVLESYTAETSSENERLEDYFKSIGVDAVHVNTSESYLPELMRYFRRRAKLR
jgi:uncharacterized protein (DUF58 family)